MFAFLSSRQLLLITHRNRRTQFQLGLLQEKTIFSIKSFTSIALPESEQQKTHSFTVSYLINSCGLSPKSALLASHKVHFENPDKPDLVLNLLKESGFNDSQITKFVTKIPRLLLSHPENTLLPKFEFLRSIGVSGSDLPRILSLNPDVLRRSLKNNLIPCYDFLKSLLLENEKVITALGRSQRAFLSNGTTTVVPNIALLREVGAPPSTISYLVTRTPSVVFIKPSKFVRAVQEVKEMGFDPSKFAFVQAIEVVLSIKKPTWEYKFEIFRRWGWSKEDTLLAFRRFPNFMLLSDEKITKVMNFVVNKLGRPSTDILMNPVILNLSLEKRIIPRCSVVQILLAKNLIKSDLSLSTFLIRKEKFFLEKFVIKFQDNVPQLLSVYQTKMDLLDVEIQSEKDDGDDISGDENMSFGSAEDDDELEETPKKVESSKKRPSESATKTPVPAKKAKAATPQKTDGKKVSGHTVTPHPSKKGAKTPATSEQSKQKSPKSGLSALKLVFSPTQRPSMLAISDWAITTFAAVA